MIGKIDGRNNTSDFDELETLFEDEYEMEMLQEDESQLGSQKDELFEHDIDRFLSGESDQDILQSAIMKYDS